MTKLKHYANLLKGGDILKLEVHPMITKVINSNSVIDKVISDATDVEVNNYRFTYAFKKFGEIPKEHFYDVANNVFPTGLIEKVELALSDNNIAYSEEGHSPKPFFTENDIFTEPVKIGDRETSGKYAYQLDAINSVIENSKGVLNLAVSSGKTFIAAVIINKVLPKLQEDEHIIFFTSSSDIFDQTLETLHDLTGQDIGYYASGKFKDRTILVVMLQSAYALLKIDPYSKLKLTPKEQELKKLSLISRKLSTRNAIQALQAHIRFMPTKTKVAKSLQTKLQKMADNAKSNKELMEKFDKFDADYNQIVNTKAKDKIAKKKFIVDLLNSALMIVQDECQHLSAMTFYKVLLNCHNAIVAIGLSGTIDSDNKVLQQSINSIFRGVIYRRKLKENVSSGVSSPANVHMISITSPKKFDDSAMWQEVYSNGIVNNEYRNKVIIDLIVNKIIPSKRPTLVIVQQIEHGRLLQKMLHDKGYDFDFTNGQLDKDKRNQALDNFKNGKKQILIASNVLDEGIDIPKIACLVNVSGMKSFRVVVQRLGRTVRLSKEFKDVHVFDFIDVFSYILGRQSRERMNIYKEEGTNVLLNK